MLAPTRLGNAASQLPLRGQPRRKALRSYPAGQVRRKETHPHHPSAPLPPLRGSGLDVVGGVVEGAAEDIEPVDVQDCTSTNIEQATSLMNCVEAGTC